jgi:4-amino-4-deoxychorismate lyase
MNRTLLYGEGLFETILWRGETPKLKLHYKRLRRSAEFLGIPCPDYRGFLKAIEEETGGRRELYVKFLLLSEGPAEFWGSPQGYRVQVLVGRPPEVPREVPLMVSSHRRHSRDPLSRHKTTSYLFNVLVRREARGRGFYDALILNERDHVTECSAANVILVKGDRMYTPSRESGLLRGTTLEVLSLELPVEETYLTLRDLLSGGSLFLTNSLVGAVCVSRIGDAPLPVDRDALEEMRKVLERFNPPPET